MLAREALRGRLFVTVILVSISDVEIRTLWSAGNKPSKCAVLSMSVIGLLDGLYSQQLPDLAHGVIHLHLENALAEFGA